MKTSWPCRREPDELRAGVVGVGGALEQAALDEGCDVPAHGGQVEVELVGEVGGAHRLEPADVGEHRDR